MSTFVPAEVFPPGYYIKWELEARDWTQGDLAAVMRRPLQAINEIINAKKRVTGDTARELELALGIDADWWVRTEALYRLHTRSAEPPKTILRHADLRKRVPLRHLINRGWIESTDDQKELERRVEAFLEGPIDKPISFTMAAKQSSYDEPLSSTQAVWLLRAKQLAQALQVLSYSRAKLLDAVEEMRGLLRSPDDAYQVPRLLANAGVRFVVVERLPGLKIDGVCFWLKNGTQPVIAMSLTRDRIDNFWFVLRHEIEHVLNDDGKDGSFVVDNDLDQAPDVSEQEKRANTAACNFCVPQDKFVNWVERKQPLFTDTLIREFARDNGLHSGLVAGQLRMRLSKGPLGGDAWKRFTTHLARVRHVVISTALVDGFGSSPQIDS